MQKTVVYNRLFFIGNNGIFIRRLIPDYIKYKSRSFGYHVYFAFVKVKKRVVIPVGKSRKSAFINFGYLNLYRFPLHCRICGKNGRKRKKPQNKAK